MRDFYQAYAIFDNYAAMMAVLVPQDYMEKVNSQNQLLIKVIFLLMNTTNECYPYELKR